MLLLFVIQFDIIEKIDKKEFFYVFKIFHTTSINY